MRFFVKICLTGCHTPAILNPSTGKELPMSPSQRAANKQVFSVSFERELVAAIAEECKRLGIDRNAFIMAAAKEKLKKEQTKKENKENK